MFIRTKAKNTEFKDDIHHFTNKWSEDIPIGRVRGDYIDNPNLEVREDKSSKATEITGEPEIAEPEVAPNTDT